jgi:hypothetical protein
LAFRRWLCRAPVAQTAQSTNPTSSANRKSAIVNRKSQKEAA